MPARIQNPEHLSAKISELPFHPGYFDLGNCTASCLHCHALHWAGERAPNGDFEKCCKKGSLGPFPQPVPPLILQELYTNTHVLSKEFLANIRTYNAALSFCSVAFTRDNRAFSRGHAPQVFQVHGAVYHRGGPLRHAPDAHPIYAQLYFYDSATAADFRVNRNPSLSRELLSLLSAMCDEYNQFSRIYRRAQEGLNNVSTPHPDDRIFLDPQFNIQLERGRDKNRENLPTTPEIALIIPSEYTHYSSRDILLTHRTEDPTLRTLIPRSHPAYFLLAYALLFSYSQPGLY